MFWVFFVAGLVSVGIFVYLRDTNRPHFSGNRYGVRVAADSISPQGHRLTTLIVTFPRFILAEFNTHRVFSRNSASSRAIPIRKQLLRVIYYPFVPLGFGTAQPGMVAGKNLSGWKAMVARQVWLKARWVAVAVALILDALGVHKAFANRVLEPWLWHTVIVTSTEWDNFFALRTDEAAQPEFRHIAEMMQATMALSRPKEVRSGDWHLPLITHQDLHDIALAADTSSDDFIAERAAMVSVGRCARVSFDTHDMKEHFLKSISRAEMLNQSGHWSPFEHQAQVVPDSLRFTEPGNFSGDWEQLRKRFENEDNFGASK